MGWVAAIGQHHASITQPPPPGGTPPAGPIDGAQAIRDAAGPDPVLDPGGGISFTTRADLQTKIDANAANSIFVHAAGSSETWTTQLNVGTKNPRIYFLGLAGSTATTINGGGTNVTGINSTNGSGFEVHGGLWTGFGAVADVLTITHRAIRANGPCTIEDVIATNSHVGIGVTPDGDNTTIRRCRTHANHRYGILQSGAPSYTENLLIEHTIIENNNTSQLNFDDASGTKFSSARNAIVRKNWVKNNYGWGIWPDGFNETFEISENVTEDNWRGGIFWELNHGGGNIIRNACFRDCAANTEVETRHTRAAILVSESDGTLGPGGGTIITRNIVDTSAWPIHLFDNDNRALVTTDCDVTLNDFWLRSSGSRIGGDDAKITKTMHNDASLTWVSNTYHVLSLGTSNWYWPTASNASLQQSFSAWEGLSITTTETRITI